MLRPSIDQILLRQLATTAHNIISHLVNTCFGFNDSFTNSEAHVALITSSCHRLLILLSLGKLLLFYLYLNFTNTLELELMIKVFWGPQ